MRQQMLNKNLNVPLYAQLKELILGEIQSGALKAGDMIPTEHELMEQYSISRNVVRQAIGELVEGGYLIRKKAKGTFVSTSSANLEKISTLEPFRESALRTGAIPTTKVLSMEVLDADEEIANRLEIDVGMRVIRILRLHYSDDMPVSLSEDVLPYSRCSFVLGHRLQTDSLHRVLNYHTFAMRHSWACTKHSSRRGISIWKSPACNTWPKNWPGLCRNCRCSSFLRKTPITSCERSSIMQKTGFDAYCEQAQSLGVLGMNVTKDDQLLVSWRSEGECRRNIYSATKSFTACAVGFAVQESPCEHLKEATVRDLLTMRLGQKKGFLMGEQRPFYDEDDWVRLSLAQPFEYAPGTCFVYNNAGPYLAGILVQRRAGCDLVSYLTPRLFAPMGIKRPTWESDPLGNSFGAGGLFLTLTELHRFGLFCLNRGAWNGRQLLNPAWIDACAAPQDGEQYGYLFWRGEHGSFRADGKYGQLSVIVPDRQAVVTVVSECRNGEKLMALINQLIDERL